MDKRKSEGRNGRSPALSRGVEHSAFRGGTEVDAEVDAEAVVAAVEEKEAAGVRAGRG